MADELEEAAKLVPEGLAWSVGTGTVHSHAQILPDGLIGRRQSFFAVAETEAEALKLAAREAADYVREMHFRLCRQEH